MNKRSITPINTDHLKAEETQRLNLWDACGLSVVLNNAEIIAPFLLYLQHGTESEDGFARRLGYPCIGLFKRGLWQSAVFSLSKSDTESFMWVFESAPYPTVLRLLRAKLRTQFSEAGYL